MADDVRDQPKSGKEAEPGRKEATMGQQVPSPSCIDYRGADLRGTSMAGVVKEYADFRGANVRGVNFSGSNLSFADFRGADADGANFQNAKLFGAKMQGVEAIEADFRHSDLSGANFGGSKVVGANFQNAKLYGAKMQGVEAFNADFRNTDLRQANFDGAYLEKAMMPPLERRASPGEIGGQSEQDAKTMRESAAGKLAGVEDRKAADNQQGQTRENSPDGEQRDKSRGKGR